MEIRFVDQMNSATNLRVREFLSDLLDSSMSSDCEAAEFLVRVISQLERCIEGPALLISRGHWVTISLSLEGSGNLNLSVGVVPRANEQATVNFSWSSDCTPLTGTLAFHVNGPVQTAIAVVFAFQSLLKQANMSMHAFAYRNENPEAPVDSENDCVQCPHCRFEFSLDDPNAWDGTQHLVCSQRLKVRIVRISHLRKMTRGMGE